MKTIATVAVLMMLAAPTWADEAQNEQANDPANANKPIVLSEAEMDEVTAGYYVNVHSNLFLGGEIRGSTSSTSSTTDPDVLVIGDLNSY